MTTARRRPPVPIEERADLIGGELYRCKVCGELLKGRPKVYNHFVYKHQENTFPCPDCRHTANQEADRKRHLKSLHTPPNKDDLEQRRCDDCKNAWPYRPTSHAEDCPKPQGKLRKGWIQDKTGICRRNPYEDDDEEEEPGVRWVRDSSNPSFRHYEPKSELPGPPSSGSNRQLSRNPMVNLDTDLVMVGPTDYSTHSYGSPTRQRSTCESFPFPHSPPSSTCPSFPIEASPRSTTQVHLRSTLPHGPTYRDHEGNLLRLGEYNGPPLQNNLPWLDPQLRSTTPLNPYLGPDGTINPSDLSDPYSHLRKKPQLCLGKARIPITPRQSLRYHDLAL